MENSLADKIRIAVNDIITDVRAELDAKLAALEARVMALEDRPAAPAQDDRSLNFVIYDMAESENENIEEKVNNLVSTQLSLPEVKVEAAQRKHKPEGRDAGIILVKCSDISGKRKIMEAKSKLNTFEHFKHIRIFHEKPRWQRQHEANVRLLVKSLGTNKLFVRGNRVCARGDQRKHGTIPIDLKLMVTVKVVIEIVVRAEAPLGATDGVLVEGIIVAEMEGVGCVNDGLVVSGMYMVGPWIQGVTNLRFEHVPLTRVILIYVA